MRRLWALVKSPGVGLGLMALLVAAVVLWRGPLGASAADDEISPMQTRIFGYSEWLAGSTASLRVITTNHETGAPLQSAVQISLKPEKGEPVTLFRGRTDAHGTLDASFSVPDLAPGSYELAVQARSALMTDTVKRPVRLADAVQILVTTDKPIYQPGQVIHLRALALRKPSLKPVADKITLEVEDAKGNKVFKKTMPASKFGIASADFELAREINLGVWTVRAVLPQGQTEKKVTVDRYVLPKFKVTVKTDKPFYLPGQLATGSVQADYFFGKPVSGGEVKIEVSTFDIGWTQIAEVVGKTGQDGHYKFEAQLPESFVSQPLEQGKALVRLEASVVDKADHKEKATISVPVAKDPLVITVVPESGKLRKRLENTVYIMVTTPDGTPVDAGAVSVSRAPSGSGPVTVPVRTERTDPLGIAEFRLTPREDTLTISVRANDAAGHVASRQVTLSAEQATDAILLRTDKALAAVGNTITLTAICTRPRGTVYIDAVKDRQTVLTRAVDLEDGKATLRMPITPDLVGTVEFHAYKILPSEDIIRDSRTVYISAAKDLRIAVAADKETYRPGGKANLTFTVTDQNKHPVLAALGITVVDESVFALQEMQPGFEKIYFTLEKELMEPRYEIHGLRPASVISGDLPLSPDARNRAVEHDALRQEAAKVLFASAPKAPDFTLTANTYTERLQEKTQGWVKQMGEDAQAINRALRAYQTRHHQWLDPNEKVDLLVDERLLARSHLRDPWGRPYRVHWQQNWCTLDSAGPDGKWGTDDDLLGIGEWAAQAGAQIVRDKKGRFRAFFGGVAEGEGGDFGGGRRWAGPPMLAMGAMAMEKAVDRTVAAKPAAAAGPGAEPVRVRQFFPETMFVEPALITDERGRARLSIEMADSITTWRLSALGSSLDGLLGSTTQGLRCFQDFFVDIDLPVALTQNDEVEIPIAIYNYLPEKQTVRLKLEQEDWFELLDKAEKSVEMQKNDVGVAYFRFKVKGIGMHTLTVRATGAKLSDAIKREIEVLPDGKEIRDTWNDRLEKDVERTVTIPKEAIAGASTILVKVYPGFFSQAVEGLDSLLRMPFGCFEQTSAVTYPNVLVMNYLKTTKQIKPELQMKAEQYVNVGYQRLVSYEVKGGGFSWFGDAPAHKILTAYGLLEFTDMAKVHEVDPRLIERTQRWLASQQNKDGTWEPDKGGIAEGIINRQQGVLRVTAYIAWALAESGYKGPELDKALDYVRAHWAEETDPYGLAVVANAFLSRGKDDPDGIKVADRLAEMAIEKDQIAYWQSKTPTFTSAKADSADLEATGLAAYALVKSGRHVALVNKVLTYLIQSKDSYGTWNTTQATVWALKTLLLALERATAEINATVTVSINGSKAGSFEITPENSDVMRQIDLREYVKPGANEVKIGFSGKGSALYQIVSKYYLPWDLVKPPAKEVLDIKVAYDKTTLAKDDTATCTVTVQNNADATAEMVIIDLGLPPGFVVDTADLDKVVEDKTIQKYTMAARQIIVYVAEIAPRKSLTLTYHLRAKFPIKAKTPKSETYLYYNPDVKSTAKPVEMTVKM